MSAITHTEVKGHLPNDWEGNLASAETSENSNTETVGSLSNEDCSTEIEFVPTEDCFHSIFGVDTPDWTMKQPKIEEEETYFENTRIMVSSSSCASIQDRPSSTHSDKKPIISHEQYQSALKAKIKCPNCYFTTINRGNLKQHMKKHANPAGGRTYTCEICDFKTKYKNSMKNHNARHEETGRKRRKK